MKKLLTFIVILFAGYTAMAQCPAPSFTYVQSPLGNGLLNVSFTNTTVYTAGPGQQVSYSFDCGGNGNADNNGSFTFSTPGTYNVIMTMNVTDDSTLICSSADTQAVTVAYTSCGTTLSSSVLSNTATSETVSFTANTPAGATGMTYAWNFGDGTTGSGGTATHTYASSGNYTVTLTAANGSCTYTNSMIQQIVILNCDSLFANFTYAVSYNTANFTNTSTNPNQGLAYFSQSLSWNYGDGTTGGSSAHTYAASGTYNVALTTTWVDDSNLNAGTCTKTITLPVTVGAAPNAISGTISYSGATPVDTGNFKIWLIQKNGNILTAVDSIYANSYYKFNNEPDGVYMVKAEILVNDTPGVTGYVPTYATASLYWSNALNVTHAGGNDSGINIIMQQGTIISGPGFVSGNVLTGANKSTSDTTTPGIPVAGMLIYLRNASTNVVTYQYTDQSGNYTFSNLPVGNYSTYPEAAGYATIPFNFTISNNQTTVNDVDFQQHTVSMSITPVLPTAVSNVIANETRFNVYPNPTTGQVNIQWQVAATQNAQISVADVVGRKVFESNMNLNAGAGNEKLDVSGLKDGLYIMTVKSDDINYSQKLIVQH